MEDLMRIIALLIVVFLMSFSFCMADDSSLQRAYSLYYQGKMKAAIEIMEGYIKERPDPRALYFLGYAYYKIKKMDMALKYFNEVYLIDPNFTPVVGKGD
jgi:tetratricopeptide (TPR) repeat protein